MLIVLAATPPDLNLFSKLLADLRLGENFIAYNGNLWWGGGGCILVSRSKMGTEFNNLISEEWEGKGASGELYLTMATGKL